MIWKKRKAEKSPSDTASEPPPREVRGRKRRVYLGALVCVLLAIAGVAALGILVRTRTLKQAQELQKQTQAGPLVEAVTVERSPSTREVGLIGEAIPYFADTIYARVSGYLIDLPVDKGDHVSAGQLLARIESPETDKAYLAALADSDNKSKISARYRVLLKRKLVSPQEAQGFFAQADIARQTLQTQAVLKSYEQIKAPFDGVITGRFVDPGALIQNASNSQAAQILLTMSLTDRLRIYVYVDQKDAGFVRVGDPARITQPERPGWELNAQVTRTSGQLDTKTRKLLTEIDVDNAKQEIVSGSFVQTTLKIQVPSYLELPVGSLLVRFGKTDVPVIDANNTVHYREVKVIANDGEKIKISEGLQPGERVAVHLGNSVVEGQKVRLVTMAGKASAQGTPSPSPSPGPSP